MLDLALVLALSAQCAPGVSPQTLAAIAHTESRFNPLAIGVNRGAAVRQPRTREEAGRVARRLIASGANIDLGLAQINSSNLGWLRLSVEDAFDPCRNLTAAGTVLRAGFDPASTAFDRQQALRVRPVPIQHRPSRSRLSQRLCRARGSVRGAPGPGRLRAAAIRSRIRVTARSGGARPRRATRRLGRVRARHRQRDRPLRPRLTDPNLERQPVTLSPIRRRQCAVGAIALATTLMSVQPAFASANVEGLLQNVVDMLTGNTARLLAILAVVIVGILWMFGLFDLRRAAIVILGIVVVFGAAEIVGLITGGA